MKYYYLKISSRNEKSLKNFLSFFFYNLKTKFNIIQKLVTTHNSKKIITLLKSPHVNKTAQEHFEVNTLSRQIMAKSFYLEKNLIFLKKFLNKLFQDISINLEFITHKNINFENNLFIFYPDNFKLPETKPCKTNLKRNKQKNKPIKISLEKTSLFNLTKFLNIISIFGEMMPVNCLDSF